MVGRVPSPSTEGLVKIIADAETDRVLGVHIFSAQASRAYRTGGPDDRNAGHRRRHGVTIFAHPTLAESVHEAAYR